MHHSSTEGQPTKVSVRTKFTWGVGGIADCMLSYGVSTLVMPIYNIGGGL